MKFNEQEFESYAKLILHLVDVGEGDLVLINTDFSHQPLVAQLIRQAYALHAKYVQVVISSEYLDGLRATYSKESYLEYFPSGMKALYQEFNDARACVISIRSPVDPEVNKHVSAKNLAHINARQREALLFFRQSVLTDKFSWIVVSFPSEGWAKNVFPNLSGEEGAVKLWQCMQPILRLDTSNPILIWQQQQQKVIARRKYLIDKQYSALNFVSEGTNLTVVLNKKSIWLGAAHTSENGKYFQANLPTEEVYTSPDCRYTEGYVSVQRPLPIFGKKAEGITMKFKAGKVIEAKATTGDDVLQQYLDVDERNRYLGEIALVDTNSPIWQSGLVFNNILFDENAGVHFALGAAYTGGYGFSSSESPETEELLAMGCNASKYHLDFVIGSNGMCVYGLHEDGSKELLIEHGLFVDALN